MVFCSHKSFQTTGSVVVLALVAGLMLSISVQGQIIDPPDPPSQEEPWDLILEPIPDQSIIGGASFDDISLWVLATYALDGYTPSGNSAIDVSFTGNTATLTYPSGWTGSETITITVTDIYDHTASQAAVFTVLPPPTGSICGSVVDDVANPIPAVTVKVIDADSNQVDDPAVTDADGGFYFGDLEIGAYSVMIVTPLGYAVSPSETQIDIEPGNPCTEVNFILTPTVMANDCRSMGYWKHQFDVYLTGRGNAHETESDLWEYLAVVYNHFDLLSIYIDLANFDFEDAKNVLTVKGGQLMEARAKQQLFALLLNFASGRIGNSTIVTDDGRNAADAVTLAAGLINDGDASSDELAKDICETINQGQMIAAGLVPISGVLYKQPGRLSLPGDFRLDQNHPNPFNPATEVSFFLPQGSWVELTVYNITGQQVATLAEGHHTVGRHTVVWDAAEFASGIYFYRLTTDDFTKSMKMVLMK